MSPKKIISEQLRATHNQKNWFVSLKDAISNLTAEDAAKKDSSGNHSVWGIVNHLIFWNGRWLTRLNGSEPDKMGFENSETFPDGPPDDGSWENTLTKVNKIFTDIEDRINEMPEEELGKEAFPGYGASWYEMLTHMTIHNAYHIGQIVHLRKQFGNWNAEKGVS